MKRESPPGQEQGLSHYDIDLWPYVINPAFDPCEESPSAGWRQVYVCMGVTSWA